MCKKHLFDWIFDFLCSWWMIMFQTWSLCLICTFSKLEYKLSFCLVTIFDMCGKLLFDWNFDFVCCCWLIWFQTSSTLEGVAPENNHLVWKVIAFHASIYIFISDMILWHVAHLLNHFIRIIIYFIWLLNFTIF